MQARLCERANRRPYYERGQIGRSHKIHAFKGVQNSKFKIRNNIRTCIYIKSKILLLCAFTHLVDFSIYYF